MILSLLCALPIALADDPWASEDEEEESEAPAAWTTPTTPAPPSDAWTPTASGWGAAPSAAPDTWAPPPSTSTWSPNPTPNAGAWAPNPTPNAGAWAPNPTPNAGAWAPSPTPAPSASAWSTSPAPSTSNEAADAWSLPDAPPPVNPAWSSTPATPEPSGAWTTPSAPQLATPPAATYTPPAAPSTGRIRSGRACLSDLCARGDRLDVGPFDFDGVSAVADVQVGYTRPFVDGELGASRWVPVAGAAATWTTDTFSLDMPWSAQLLASPVQTWRDFNGDVIRSHGGAMAINLGGLMSVGLGTGHHTQFPVVFRDADQDGVVDDGELSRSDSRWTNYGFLVFTPVTFIRQVGPQLWG